MRYSLEISEWHAFKINVPTNGGNIVLELGAFFAYLDEEDCGLVAAI
jgi:hypothetical protein